MKIAICDDEESVRDYLKRLFDETREKHEIALFSDGKSLLKTEVMEYDVILLDIEMDGMNGIKIAEQIRSMQEQACRDIWGGLPLIIFVTGYKEHMQDAFGVHAFAYLLKPFEKAAFYKIYEQMVSVWKKRISDSERYLLIKTRGEVKRIPVDKILYIESEKRKNILHLPDEKIVYYGSMEELANELPNDFFRVHKGYFVNMAYVEQYDRNEITVKGGDVVLLSKYRYAEFVNAYLKFIR